VGQTDNFGISSSPHVILGNTGGTNFVQDLSQNRTAEDSRLLRCDNVSLCVSLCFWDVQWVIVCFLMFLRCDNVSLCVSLCFWDVQWVIVFPYVSEMCNVSLCVSLRFWDVTMCHCVFPYVSEMWRVIVCFLMFLRCEMCHCVVPYVSEMWQFVIFFFLIFLIFENV
jgi:hypothetical protein